MGSGLGAESTGGIDFMMGAGRRVVFRWASGDGRVSWPLFWDGLWAWVWIWVICRTSDIRMGYGPGRWVVDVRWMCLGRKIG